MLNFVSSCIVVETTLESTLRIQREAAMEKVNHVFESVKSVDDITPGQLPGYFFPKLIEFGHLIIDPFEERSTQNICYYLHLGRRFRKPRAVSSPIDPLSKTSIEEAFEPYQEFDEYILEPNRSIIGQTMECLGISDQFLAKLENTTQLGRIFINHASHGFIHPGHGISDPFQLMVELTNLGAAPVKLTPGLPIFRMYLEKLAYPADEFRNAGIAPKLKMDSTDKS